MKEHPFIAVCMLISCISSAQTFTNLQNGFPTLTIAAFAWGDYDNDGDSDLVITGFSGVTADVSTIYRNDGSGNFTPINSGIEQVSSGSANWGDFDNDGDPDLLITGMNNGQPVTRLYRNDGNDIFTAISTNLSDMIGIARWIDYDNDGRLDVIMSGLMGTGFNDSIKLFHNDSAGIFTEAPTLFPNNAASDIEVADFDNDGDQDFFFTGYSSTVSDAVCHLYRNDGNGIFSTLPLSFYNLSTGTAKWGDYDNDGDLDLLYDGIDSTASFPYTLLYRNDNGGAFTEVTTNLPGSGENGSVDFGDVNNDGKPDIILSGTFVGAGTKLFLNNGTNAFTDITPTDFLASCPSGFIDMDNDGDLDILLIQQSGGFNASTIFRNDLIATAAPSVQTISDFNFFPVPASNLVTLRYKGLSATSSFLKIYDTNGSIVLEQTSSLSAGENSIQINCSNLRPGTYLARLLTSSEIIEKKIMIE